MTAGGNFVSFPLAICIKKSANRRVYSVSQIFFITVQVPSLINKPVEGQHFLSCLNMNKPVEGQHFLSCSITHKADDTRPEWGKEKAGHSPDPGKTGF